MVYACSAVNSHPAAAQPTGDTAGGATNSTDTRRGGGGGSDGFIGEPCATCACNRGRCRRGARASDGAGDVGRVHRAPPEVRGRKTHPSRTSPRHGDSARDASTEPFGGNPTTNRLPLCQAELFSGAERRDVSTGRSRSAVRGGGRQPLPVSRTTLA